MIRRGLQIKKALYILSIWVGFGWWESEDIQGYKTLWFTPHSFPLHLGESGKGGGIIVQTGFVK